MKKTMPFLLPILLGFVYVLAHYLGNTGYLNFNMLCILLLVYCVWLVMAGVPAIAAFGFQLFVCNITRNPLIRLIPTVLVLAAITYECIRPFYGVYLNLVSLFLGLTPYLAIPIILFGLLAGWLMKVRSVTDEAP